MKKSAAVILSFILFMPMTNAYALTDEYILNDQAQNTYMGRIEAPAMIENLRFNDINGHWAQEAIVRDGALNLVKGYGKSYNPNGTVSNAEAIAFVLRAIGRENEAVELGAAMQAQAAAGSALRTVWSLGYLNLANQLGLITPQEYASGIAPAGTNSVFGRDAAATRERIADWIVRGLRTADANALPRNASVQKMLNYSDFDSVTPAYADAVDIVTLNKIMNGDGNGNFNPKKGITRAEIAQVLKNMDNNYFYVMGYLKKTGTVGTTQDSRYKTTGQEFVWRSIYVRTSDGTVDNLMYARQSDNVLSNNIDAVVYRNGETGGLASLAEGDEIEYIVDTNTNEVMYVQVTKGLDKATINAYLYSVNTAEGTINVTNSAGNHLIYSIIEGLAVNENGVDYIRIDDNMQDINKLPSGSILKIELANNIVTKLSYIGNPAVVNEIRGIVVENNRGFGYITIIDNSGKQLTKYYYEDDLKVKKQQYYDMDDKIGYIDEVFPNFEFNPRVTDISQIEPGDIVFLRISDNDASAISAISASTDYIMKYGKVKQISNGIESFSLLMEYEDKQTGWYDVADDIFVSLDGKPISVNDIKVGDWAKLLVNQAIIAPGNVMESVKEIAVEGGEHFISGIVKGELSGINDVQGQLVLKNSYALDKTGWSGYKNLTTYSLSGKDIEYYYNAKRISLDYAKQYFKRSDATVYVALENNYMGDRVRKVTFRIERDETLQPDTIIYSSGAGDFGILSHGQNINADTGTIVRRHGRLVDPQDIMSSDYAYVVLNGNNKAAVVDIIEAPGTSGIMVARGRVQSVKEGNSFKVQSMSVLSGNEWIYTPVQREFSIDHNTLFIDADGIADSSKFIGYTDATVVDKVYNIIADGSRAAYVVDSPYCTKGVKGTVYKLEAGTVYLKDAYYYNDDTGKWKVVSNRDATISVAILNETIIAKNNKIMTQAALETGDQIRVMTNSLPDPVSSGTQVDGYIIIVEK